RLSPFMRDRAAEQLKQLTAEVGLTAKGTFRCPADKEPHFTRPAVERCESHLRAVSYEDESWWSSGPGDRYLGRHEDLQKAGVDMTRIFILTSEKAQKLRATLERHVELGIATYVLSPDEVSAWYRRDFVIYDDVLLREADSSEASGERKEAVFTDDPPR